jgi:Domain of unknown function (DUF5615)
VKLLLDEMFPRAIAEQLRARGKDVVSIHDPHHQWLEGAADQQVFMAAVAEGRAVVTENVADFRRLESDALARGQIHFGLIFTTKRRFPRGAAFTVGRLVFALTKLLENPPGPSAVIFLQ